MRKLKKCSLLCAVVLCDMQCSWLLWIQRSSSVNDFSQILLGWNILKDFPSERAWPVCIANHHFGTVTICLQKISKFIVETDVQNSDITFKSQGSGEQSGPNGRQFATQDKLHNLNIWGQLFKTNDVFSKRYVKISNVNNWNMPIFFVEKMWEAFAMQKLLTFFQQKLSVYF